MENMVMLYLLANAGSTMEVKYWIWAPTRVNYFSALFPLPSSTEHFHLHCPLPLYMTAHFHQQMSSIDLI